MNEEIDENEFYHQDFTTASEWEIFVARMEEIIHQWKVDEIKNDEVVESKDVWNIKEEKLYFADVEFILNCHRKTSCFEKQNEEDDDKKIKNPMDNIYDFPSNDADNTNNDCMIANWYGLNEYITLCVAGNSGIISESQIKVLLSSIQIVIGNTGCQLPLFVQIREKWQHCYLGVYENDDIRTNFEMIHLRKGPQHCQYLAGLLDLFKNKIMSPESLGPITVSVQFTYHLNDFGNANWKQDVADADSENFDINTMSVLPFGVTFDPVNTLILKTTWSHLSDHLIVDFEHYSDLDPMQAPKWSMAVKLTDEPVCLLAESIIEVLNLIGNNSTIYDMLGDFASNSIHEMDNPLDVLTEPKLPTISTVIKRAARNSLSKSRKGSAPISEEVLVPILYFLFPDADEDPVLPYCDKQNKEKENGDILSSYVRLI